jgi:ADP-ribose pyrophosphatase YjhB (NUDIX family)
MMPMMAFKKIDSDTLREHKGKSFVGVVTCFLLYDKDGYFFMAKRSKNARDEQGKWEIQGGGLKWGQTAMENALREMKEESNAVPKKIEFLGYRDIFRTIDGVATHWISLDFAALVDRKTIKINEPDMFDDSGWFTLSQQPSPVHSQHKETIKDYEDRLNKILKQ